jgi:putative transposase
MGKYRKWSHTTYDCRYHLVWITKYRNKCLTDWMQKRLEKILRWVCKEWYIWIISIWMEEDHVHMYISIPLSKPIPQVVQALKWRSSKVLREEYEIELSKWYWKPVLWAKWYFIATVGEINHETIKNYVDMQGKEDVLWIEVEI